VLLGVKRRREALRLLAWQTLIWALFLAFLASGLRAATWALSSGRESHASRLGQYPSTNSRMVLRDGGVGMGLAIR
jgi:hypothetical protein